MSLSILAHLFYNFVCRWRTIIWSLSSISGFVPGKPHLVTHLSSCVTDLANSHASIRLQLNPSKTEFIWFGTRHSLAKLPTEWRSLTICSSVIQCADVVRDLGVLLDSVLSMQSHISKVPVSIMWEGYVRSGIMSLEKSWHNSSHHSSFLALTTAILCSPAFLHLPWRLCNVYRIRLLDLCSIVTGGRTLLQYCISCTGCPSSTASSSRLRRWCTTFYIIDVHRISLTWWNSTRQTLIDINSGRCIPEQPSWNKHGPNLVNASIRLVVPTYGTVFLQQSATLTVIQHLDEL